MDLHYCQQAVRRGGVLAVGAPTSQFVRLGPSRGVTGPWLLAPSRPRPCCGGGEKEGERVGERGVRGREEPNLDDT